MADPTPTPAQLQASAVHAYNRLFSWIAKHKTPSLAILAILVCVVVLLLFKH